MGHSIDPQKFSAAFHTTVGTDRGSAVTAFRHGRLAAGHTDVAVTGYVFDLAVDVHADLLKGHQTNCGPAPTQGSVVADPCANWICFQPTASPLRARIRTVKEFRRPIESGAMIISF